MSWSALNFGKYTGKTLPQVMFNDPDWFFWAVENGSFEGKGAIAADADDIYQKSQNIKIPGSDDRSLVVQYYVHQPTGKFSHFEVVPADQPEHHGSSPTIRSKKIDMRMPRQISSYDKLGYTNFLSSLKFYLFGNKSVRMNQKRCETFFDDPDNFIEGID